MREVVLWAMMGQVHAAATLYLKVLARQGKVANTRCRPHVAHSPHHRFAILKNLLNGAQRRHPLVNPLQMNNVSSLKLGQRRDTGTHIGYINMEQMMFTEMQMPKYTLALPQKMQPFQCLMW